MPCKGRGPKNPTTRSMKCPISAVLVWNFKCPLPQLHALLPYTNHPTCHGGFSTLENLPAHPNPSLPSAFSRTFLPLCLCITHNILMSQKPLAISRNAIIECLSSRTEFPIAADQTPPPKRQKMFSVGFLLCGWQIWTQFYTCYG